MPRCAVSQARGNGLTTIGGDEHRSTHRPPRQRSKVMTQHTAVVHQMITAATEMLLISDPAIPRGARRAAL